MKKLLSIIIVMALVIGMMPMTVLAIPSDGPIADDEAYYKLIVDTGGKGDISIKLEAEEEYPGMLSMHEDEPNVIYVSKEMYEEYSNDFADVDDFAQVIQLPEPKGFQNGMGDWWNEFFLVDPSTVTSYDSYSQARRDTYGGTLPELVVDDELTIYAVWFEEVDKLSVEITAPRCGDVLGEESKVEVTIPSGQKWQIPEDNWEPFWGEWEQSEIGYGWYELFQGTVKGGDDSVAVVPFEGTYGYYFGELKPEDVTVTYKDWQGNNIKGSVDHMQSGFEPESEVRMNYFGAKVKVQHVSGKKEITDVVKPSCTKAGSHREIIRCSKCKEILSDKKVVDKATGHKWGPWKVVKKATFKKDGLKKRVCKNDPSHVQTKKIPAKGKGQTLLMTMKPKGANKLVASWKKVKNIDGVDIYFTHCNKKEKKSTPKLYKSIKGNKKTSYTIKGLKKNTAYKAYAKAWIKKNGKKKYVLKSPKAHVFTGGESKGFTNAKSVSVKKKKITIRAKKSCKIKARVKKANSGLKLIPKRHTAKLRYKSADKTIAKVNKKGRIKGVGKGTCYVYVFATTGVFKKIKVRVR